MTGAADRIPYDVNNLQDQVGEAAVNLAIWESRDPSAVQPYHRRAAAKALAAFDEMFRDLQVMRSRLAAEVKAHDDAPETGWCGRCRRTTRSVPCGRCGGRACAGCGRCPSCDGPVPDEEE